MLPRSAVDVAVDVGWMLKIDVTQAQDRIVFVEAKVWCVIIAIIAVISASERHS